MIIIKHKIVIFIVLLYFISFLDIFSQNVNIENAFNCLKNNKYNDAITDFNALIKQNDTISNFYYGRGIAYLYLGEFDNAIEDFERTIDINANFVDAYYGLFLSHIELDNYDIARTNINKAIKIDSNYYELYYVRGILNYLEKNYKNAVEDFNYILEHKNSLNALYGRAIAFYKLEYLLEASADIDTFLQNNKIENELVNECHRLFKIIKEN